MLKQKICITVLFLSLLLGCSEDTEEQLLSKAFELKKSSCDSKINITFKKFTSDVQNGKTPKSDSVFNLDKLPEKQKIIVEHLKQNNIDDYERQVMKMMIGCDLVAEGKEDKNKIPLLAELNILQIELSIKQHDLQRLDRRLISTIGEVKEKAQVDFDKTKLRIVELKRKIEELDQQIKNY